MVTLCEGSPLEKIQLSCMSSFHFSQPIESEISGYLLTHLVFYYQPSFLLDPDIDIRT